MKLAEYIDTLNEENIFKSSKRTPEEFKKRTGFSIGDKLLNPRTKAVFKILDIIAGH